MLSTLDQGNATNSSTAPVASVGTATIEPTGVREKSMPARERTPSGSDLGLGSDIADAERH
jgi:hypothetical protein